MKKRLLSALLALALVFVLLPTTALADTTPVTDENVKINGTAVTVGNDISLGEGNGTYSYDKSTRTLTLNNATITATGSNIGIDFCDTTNYVTYSVILTGENTVTSNNIAIETTPNTNLTFTGGGNLKAITNGYYQAIRVYGTLTIENSTLIAESSAYTATTVIWTLAMTGDKAKLEISNKSAANIVAGTAGPASNIDWSNYQFTTGSYSGDALTESDPEVCSWGTLKKYFGYPTKEYSQYICIAKRTIALETTSDVRIAGGPAVVGQWTNIPAAATGTGSYYYDADKKELTLKDVNITYSKGAIVQFMAGAPYIIKLEGTNSIKDVSSFIRVPERGYESLDGLSVTISGSGSLEVTARSNAINMEKGDLKFENTGEIKLTTSNISPTHNVLSVSGNITIADMEKYKVEGIVQDNTSDGGDTVTLSEASHLKGYQNPGDTQKTCLKSITIAPTPAKDSTISYGNKTLKQGETIKDGKGGTATVDRENNTITLNNFKGDKALVFNAEFTPNSITLIGDSTLSAVETKYQSLTISGSGSGSGSLTVGSIRVTNNDNISADLIITGGAQVTVNRPGNEDDRAIDIKGDLTVTNGSLTATSTSTKPTVQVGGNASFTGSTVTITNNSDRQGKSGEYSYEVSTGLYVGGTLDIKNAAKVTSTVIGGNAIYAKGDITISGDSTEVNAQNSAYKFSAISTNRTVNISDNSTVKAENLKKHQGDPTGETDPSTGKTYNACPAITGKIANKNTQNKLHIEGFTTSNPGTSNPTEGTPLNFDIDPSSAVSYILHYDVTITRGDEVTHTASPVVIAGTTLLNDTYYTITNGSTVTEGTESNYNAFYDSETKTLKLNNASINGAGVKAIEANVGGYTFTIELVGNNIIKTSGFANNVIDITGNLYFTGSGTAEISGKGMPIYATYKIDVSADVTITNTEKAGSFTFSPYGENYKGANTFAIGAGYTAYATTDKTTWAVYDNTTASENESYTTLRITKENLAPTTPTTYTVTITAGDNMKIERESGALTQEVTKGAAITEVKFIAASGHYFPADYVSKMNLPAGLTAEISGNSWYLTISGTPTSDVTINLPAASVRPTITVSMPTPVAGNTPATASDITLTYTPSQGSSRNLRVGSVIWESYVPDGPKGESIKVTGTLSSGDKFVEGTKYRATINFEGVSEDYAIVPAAGTTKWSNAEWGSSTMTLYFDATGAPCNHKYTNDWHANGNTHWHECELCKAHADEAEHTYGGWITDTEPTATVAGTKHRVCSVCDYVEQGNIPATGEIVPPTPDNPGTIVIIRPAEEEKPAQQPNPSTGANDLVGMAVAAAVVAVLGSVALLRKHD